jgi:hypothetical protein
VAPTADNESTETPGAPDEPEPGKPVPLAPPHAPPVPPDQLPEAAKLIKSDGHGHYFIMQGGKAVPIMDGDVSVVSPSTGQRLTFRGGQWWPD